MDFITREDERRIAAAIDKAEKRTSGEIVAVVAPASDSYFYIPLVWAAGLALTVPPVLIWLTALDATAIYLAQAALFVVTAAVLHLPGLRMAVVPAAVRRRRAHRAALEHFLTQNLHTTEGRTGVMIYVSVAERFADVIADDGIYAKVDAEIWQEAVDALTGEIGRGRVADGFVAGIGICGRVLAKHFPAGAKNPDELPNRLIILEE